MFSGIYESDDSNAIVSEIEKALNYSQKVCLGLGLKHVQFLSWLLQQNAVSTLNQRHLCFCAPGAVFLL